MQLLLVPLPTFEDVPFVVSFPPLFVSRTAHIPEFYAVILLVNPSVLQATADFFPPSAILVWLSVHPVWLSLAPFLAQPLEKV